MHAAARERGEMSFGTDEREGGRKREGKRYIFGDIGMS